MIGDNHISPRMSLSPIMRPARRDEPMTHTAERMTQTASGPLFCDMTQTDCWQRFGTTHVANVANSRTLPPGDGCGRKTRLQRYISLPPLPPSQGGERKCALGVAGSRGHDRSPSWWRRMASITGQSRIAGRSDQSPNTVQSTQTDKRMTRTRTVMTRAVSGFEFRVIGANHLLKSTWREL